jgi:hypothetical protein
MPSRDFDPSSLTVDQRLELIEALTASLDEAARPITDAVRGELRHRISTVSVDRELLHDAREQLDRLRALTD